MIARTLESLKKTGRTLTGTDYVLLSGFLVSYLGLAAWKFGYTMDDAYISMRYSKHVADGHGVVWNLGASPVEGYTSTMWVLVGTVPHLLGIDPIPALKVLTVVSVLVVVVGLYLYGIHADVPKLFLLPTVAMIALSPAVAYNSTLGMEATLGMLFVFISSVCVVELAREYRRGVAGVLSVTLFLGMLTRPDLVVFAGGLVFGCFLSLVSSGRHREAKSLTAVVSALVFVPGLAFMASRYLYFGQWLPNPFHVKASETLVAVNGVKYVASFGLEVIGPLFFVVLAYVLFSGRQPGELVAGLLPLVLGIGLFLGLWFFVDPIQNDLWRFQLPMLPAIAVAYVEITRTSSPVLALDDPPVRIVVAVLLLGLLVAFPLNTVEPASTIDRFGTPEDRVRVGESLNEYADRDYRMFVTEAGALPYHSEWHAVDDLGLTNRTVARESLSTDFIERYDPEVVSLIGYWEEGALANERPVSARFLDQSDEYALVAAIERTESDVGRVLYYFVDSESDGYREVACSLLGVDGVTYRNTSEYERMAEIDVRPSEIAPSECR